jgi:hypothetical protein
MYVDDLANIQTTHYARLAYTLPTILQVILTLYEIVTGWKMAGRLADCKVIPKKCWTGKLATLWKKMQACSNENIFRTGEQKTQNKFEVVSLS